jgi:hypothetical protein
MLGLAQHQHKLWVTTRLPQIKPFLLYYLRWHCVTILIYNDNCVTVLHCNNSNNLCCIYPLLMVHSYQNDGVKRSR